MPKWLWFTILSIFIWGIWGINAKMADAHHVEPRVLQAASTIGVVPVSLLLIASPGFRRNKRVVPGSVFAFATGLCASIGNLAYFYSLNRGGAASVVAPLTGMFAVVTLVLAILILGERINFIQVIGILISIVAVYLFSLPDDSSIRDGLAPLRQNLAASWMYYALISLGLFGVAAILQKLATNNISSELSTVCFALGFVPVAIFLVVTQDLDWKMPAINWVLSIGLGALIGIGGLTLFAAYRDGKASIVTALYSLYPALTAAIAVRLLGEAMFLRKGIAIALALVAAIALSFERPAQPAGIEVGATNPDQSQGTRGQ